MQNWDAMQPTANYDQHNTWYNSMFAANIKTEPGLTSPPTQSLTTPTAGGTTSQLENYLKQHHQQQQQQLHMTPMDTLSTAMTPSPSNNESMQHFFDSNMQQQLLQQQQYQQQFQQAQHAAAQNQLSSSAHLPLGFNPLTPPGLPSAVMPSMTHFYNNMRPGQQTPSPQPQQQTPAQSSSHLATPLEGSDKLQSALTPRNTPPMEVTPPKSPKAMLVTDNELDKSQLEKDQDLISNSSEDMKYMAESEDDETIRMPIYNSHGKMKNYKCKTCGMVAITKVAFWEHASAHMKPEKILQCPKCPFVTELKHHLEYHIRKHKNLKPFQCDKCSYSCVNKSMLNSHRKSHSSVYQYRCSDCDYATKYCHSFKLHLRKYDHKPGMVLDEQGIPNPSVVIDVYGTRRGPKTKSVSGGGNKRNGERLTTNNLSKQSSGSNNGDMKLSTSQLSAALQGFHQMPASPAKSTSSTTSELPTLTLNMTLQQQHQQQQQQLQQQQHQLQQQQQKAQAQTNSQQAQQTMSNLLPPLANLLQQNNMAFFPYWNLNLQMLAAQQQAAVLAQLSPRMRETALQHLQNPHAEKDGNDSTHEDDEEDDEVEEGEDEDCDRKSIDSAMDLSQGTPTKEENQATTNNTTTEVAMNLKLQDETNDTPIISSVSSSRRKGRVLKLDSQLKSASQSPEVMPAVTEMPSASSPISTAMPAAKIQDEHSSSDESMENIRGTGAPTAAATAPNGAASSNSANTSASSTASSSGNSSNSSSSSTGANSAARGGAIYECKYCDIYFKDAVLYTIHMGYHSCDDVFKCNMCGEKCDGPVGLFVHMARNAHS